MIRRLKDHEINGLPIVPLPPKTVETVVIELSEDERYIYDTWLELAEESDEEEIMGNSCAPDRRLRSRFFRNHEACLGGNEATKIAATMFAPMASFQEQTCDQNAKERFA